MLHLRRKTRFAFVVLIRMKALWNLTRGSVLVYVLVALSLSDLALAQIRQEIPIPGSTQSVARVLGLEPAPERSRFMLEVIRALYDQPGNVSPEADQKLETLYGYLDSVTALESAMKEYRGGQPELSLDGAADKRTREKLESWLELLGLKLRSRWESEAISWGKTLRVYADSCGLKTAFLGNGGRNAATIFSLRYSSSR